MQAGKLSVSLVEDPCCNGTILQCVPACPRSHLSTSINMMKPPLIAALLCPAPRYLCLQVIRQLLLVFLFFV